VADILAKIRKLLALSTSSNPHEAALAAQRAQELILKHAVSEDDLHAGDVAVETVGQDVMGGAYAGRVPSWHGHLAGALAPSFFCRVFIIPGRDILIVGRKTNREVLRATWAYLLGEITRLGDAGWKAFGEERGDMYMRAMRSAGLAPDARRWKRGFAFGAIRTIGERLADAQKRLVADTTGAALVVASRTAELDAFAEALQTRRAPKTRVPAAGYREGEAAGRALDLTPRAAASRRLAAGGDHA
jgi:hypothetical protein